MKNNFTTPADFWQERDFGQKISAIFEFLGAHWRPLGRAILYLAVPVALLRSIITALLQSELSGILRHSTYSRSGGFLSSSYLGMYSTALQSPLYLLNNALGGIFQTVLLLTVYGYLYCCLNPAQPGVPVAVPEVWQVVKRKFLGTFFSLYGVWIIIGLCLVILIIPGIYIGVVLSLFFVVSVVEDTGFGTTLNRCVSLTRGHWWATFGLLAVLAILIYLVFASIGVAAVVFKGFRSFLATSSTLPPYILIIITALSGLFTLLIYPLFMLATAFQYFNLVELKDGAGLRLLLNQLGAHDTTTAVEPDYYRPDEEGEY